jgi:hypothetical protein
MSTTSGRLRVASLDATYLVAEGHPSPERLARQLDDIVRKELPAALRTTLMPLLKSSDPSLWFIRRLDVPVDVNAGWEPNAIARSWAQRISRTLAQDLSGAGDGSNVIRFPDRAAYLARFVVDAASGDAFSHWVYRSFAGLRALPVSAAIRTALAVDPALGLAALQRLDLRELSVVVGALTEADAERGLDALAGDHDAMSLDASLPAAAAAWPAIAAQCDALSVPRAALALFVRAAAGGRLAALAAQAIATLAAVVRVRSPGTVSQLRAALLAGDLVRVRAIAAPGTPVPELLARLSTAQFDAALRAVAPASAAQQAAIEPGQTRFGGALLLLPFLDALPLDALAGDWPPLHGTSAPRVLRWLVLLKCLGQPRMDAVLHDPLLRDLFGIAPQIGWPQTAAWLGALGRTRGRELARLLLPRPRRGVGAPAADLAYLALPRSAGIDPLWQRALTVAACRVMREFAARLPGFEGSRCDYLYRNFLDLAATLEYEPARIAVRLGRPPLHLVLAMTGATRAHMRLDWLDPRPIALFGEE